MASNGWLYEAPATGTTFYQIVCNTGTWGINITGSAGSVAWGNVTSKPITTSKTTWGTSASATLTGNHALVLVSRDIYLVWIASTSEIHV